MAGLGPVSFDNHLVLSSKSLELIDMSPSGKKREARMLSWKRFIDGSLTIRVASLGALLLSCVLLPWLAGAAEPSKQALIKDAVSAAPPAIAKTVKVMDWDGTVLRDGGGTYTCFPTPPELRSKGGHEPMCVDAVWTGWAHAWMDKKDFKASHVGIAYMLAGDSGASNTDPYATAPTKDNQWVVEGPHVMVLVPDSAQLEGLPTDPNSGGAYVMWKGTPYAHIMVPVGRRPAVKK